MASGHMLRAILKTEGTVVPNTDVPGLANYIFSLFAVISCFLNGFVHTSLI